VLIQLLNADFTSIIKSWWLVGPRLVVLDGISAQLGVVEAVIKLVQ